MSDGADSRSISKLGRRRGPGGGHPTSSLNRFDVKDVEDGMNPDGERKPRADHLKADGLGKV